MRPGSVALGAARVATGGRPGIRSRLHGLAFGLALGLVTALGLAVRLAGLWPPARTVVQAPYDDEGVYVMAAQLLLQGQWPYRDYFFAHPPLGIALIAPALAVAYTAWGSALSFGLARLLMVGLGALTVTVVGLAGARLWGPAGGLVAALLLALDPTSVANSRHILLEVPMTLLAALALLPDPAGGRRPAFASGLLAGLAALVKVQALGLGLALLLAPLARRAWRQAAAVALGLAAAGLGLLAVALAVGPGLVIRQVGLFQLLRPADGLTTLGDRLGSFLAPGGLLIGLVGAALGLALAWTAGPARATARWAPVGLWVAFGLAGFLLTRSYYPHYASQVMPGLAVLAGGLGAALVGGERAGAPDAGSPTRPTLAEEEAPPVPSPSRRERVRVREIGPLPTTLRLVAGIGLVVLVGVAATQLPSAIGPRPDPTFVTVARYVADATPPAGAALATDAQFNYLASRPLPRAEGVYLVDSYGQLLYSGLGLDEGTLLDTARRAWLGRGEATVDEVIWRDRPQALLRAQMAAAEVVVVHDVGQRRLTPATRAWLTSAFRLAESTRRYDIYRRGR